MTNVTGVVQFVHKNNGGFYNIKVADEWYGIGKKQPVFGEGASVSFSYTQKGAFKNVIDGTLEVTGAASATTKKTTTGSRGDSETQQRIQFQASRNSAIAAATALVQAGAVSLGSTKNKQMDVFLTLVDDLTNRYNEATTRLSTTIDDAVSGSTTVEEEE